MKRKFSKILGVGLTVALLVSLILAAAPVSATVSQPLVTVTPNAISTAAQYTISFDTYFPLGGGGGYGTFETRGNGTAAWSTMAEFDEKDRPPSGSYAAKLTIPTKTTGDFWLHHAAVKVPYGKPLSTIKEGDFTFDYYTTVAYPEAIFAGQLYIDSGGGNVVDKLLMSDSLSGTHTNGSWQGDATQCSSPSGCWRLVDYDPATGEMTEIAGNPHDTVAGWQGTYPNATLIYAAPVWCGMASHSSDVVAYVDDVHIGTTVYDLGADTITVVFPSSTMVPDTYTASTIEVSSDGGASYTTLTATSNVDLSYATNTAVIPVPVGEATTGAAHMRVKFLDTCGVINPTTPGDYTLKVKTSQEGLYKESYAYTIGIAGVVSRYNMYGNFVSSYPAIQGAIDAAATYDSLKVSPGTYVEPGITTATPAAAGVHHVTLAATGTAAETIIKGGIALIDMAYFTLDGVTIQGKITSITGDNGTIKNCVITKNPATYYLAADTMLTNTSGNDLLVKDCTFTTTGGSINDKGIVVAGGSDTVIKGCTFTTDEGTISIQDVAIDVTGVVDDLTVDGCTFSGTKGTGVMVSAACTDSNVKNSTFDGLSQAIMVATGVTPTLGIQGNTVKNSCLATSAAIYLSAATKITLVGNTIEDNAGYSVLVLANAGLITLVDNNITGNTLGLKNSTTTLLSAIHNWWGDASGPTVATNPGGTGEKITDYVTYNPWKGIAAVATGDSAINATGLDAKATVGVIVSGLTTEAAVISVASYAANPETVDPFYTALDGGYYDVYITGATVTDTATIKFYNANIGYYTDAYYWSLGAGKWLACDSQGVSAAYDYVWVKTAAGGPTLADLAGTPFVLVAAPAILPGIGLTAPVPEETMPIVTGVSFAWASVDGATSYNLVVSANADLSSPVVEATVTVTGYTYSGTLTDGSSYFWQVTALMGTTTLARSELGAFTIKVPVEAVVPEVTVEAPDVTVTAPDVTVEAPPAEAAPTPGYIWAIIGVGAILVIALIVLIVRTRRVS